MFSLFRRGFGSWLVLGILGLVMIAFVITGVNAPTGPGGLGRGEALVEVGDEALRASEVGAQVNRQFERVRQEQPEIDLAAFFAEGAFEEILRQLVSTKAIAAFGREQGIAVSKRMVDGQIASIPAFQNLAGQFDQAAFQQALQRERLTEQELREDIAGTLIRQQLLLPVGGSAFVPQGMAEQYANLLLEQRSGSVGLVPAEALAAGINVTDQEVAAFYQRNQGRYTVPERRVLRYAFISGAQAPAPPTDAEVQAAYNANAAKYGAKETRTLSQVVLADQAAARALAGKVASGTSFADAAQQAGFAAGDIAVGEQTREAFTRLSSPAIANAAWAAAEGGTTQPIQSPLGWHVVKVEKVNRTAAVPLAAARAELVAEINARKTQEANAAAVTRVEDALADGATLDEVARSQGLQVVETPPLLSNGQSPTNPAWQTLPDVQPLLRPAFDMTADDDPVVETVAPGRYAVMGVGRVIPAAAPPLAQVAPQVRADLIRERALARARAIADGIVAKINRGMSPREAFASAGVQLPAVQPISARRIDIARPGQPVPPPLTMMFSLPEGRARALAAPEGQGWFVVHNATATPGNAAGQSGLIDATRTQFRQVLGEEYAAQFTRAVEAGMEIERDPDAIARVKRQLQTGGPVQ